ncbi:MAG: nuclear transport factor 2 family protein [Acidimicrobiales bacterium]
MEQDIGWLLDRARIRELTARYNRCFDGGDPEGFAANFTEDGVMEVAGGPSTSGRQALAEMCRRVPRGIMHVTVDATVEVNGDSAKQHVALVVIGRAGRREDKPTLMSTGRYEDDLVRTPDGWLFARRFCTLDGWTEP